MINDKSQNNELAKPDSAAISKTNAKVVRLNQAIWIMWWAGLALIVLSWINIVSPVVGWIGFSASLASTFISVIAKRYWKFPN
jgi:hypothetical protein